MTDKHSEASRRAAAAQTRHLLGLDVPGKSPSPGKQPDGTPKPGTTKPKEPRDPGKRHPPKVEPKKKPKE